MTEVDISASTLMIVQMQQDTRCLKGHRPPDQTTGQLTLVLQQLMTPTVGRGNAGASADANALMRMTQFARATGTKCIFTVFKPYLDAAVGFKIGKRHSLPISQS